MTFWHVCEIYILQHTCLQTVEWMMSVKSTICCNINKFFFLLSFFIYRQFWQIVRCISGRIGQLGGDRPGVFRAHRGGAGSATGRVESGRLIASVYMLISRKLSFCLLKKNKKFSYFILNLFYWKCHVILIWNYV